MINTINHPLKGSCNKAFILTAKKITTFNFCILEVNFLTKANIAHQQMNFCHKFYLAICTRPYNFSHGLQVSTTGVDTAWLFLSTGVARRDVSEYKAFNSLEDKQIIKSAY